MGTPAKPGQRRGRRAVPAWNVDPLQLENMRHSAEVLRAVCADLRMPWGGPQTPLAGARGQAALAPDGRLVVVPGSGHSVQSRATGNAGRQAVGQFLSG